MLSGNRVLKKEVLVKAPLDEVWDAWTTVEGLRFVSPKSNVELRIDGPYEWFLHLEPDELGKRGGQGARILEFVPRERLRSTWTFPPTVPSLRNSGATTEIEVRFDATEDGSTRVRFTQTGWQEGEDWEAGYTYFDKAWDFVLDRLSETLDR